LNRTIPVPVVIEVVLEVTAVVRVDVPVPDVKVIVVVIPLAVLEVVEIEPLVEILLGRLVRDVDSDKVVPLF
jgi:hypothetical protein